MTNASQASMHFQIRIHKTGIIMTSYCYMKNSSKLRSSKTVKNTVSQVVWNGNLRVPYWVILP